MALAINPASLGFWLERTLRLHVPASGPATEFGEPVLRLRDPDGITIKLVGSSLPAGEAWVSPEIQAEHAIRRIRGATILSETPQETGAFIERYCGFSPQTSEHTLRRLVSRSGDVIDIQDAHGFWPGSPGTGIADHIAFRVPDVSDLRAQGTRRACARRAVARRRLPTRDDGVLGGRSGGDDGVWRCGRHSLVAAGVLAGRGPGSRRRRLCFPGYRENQPVTAGIEMQIFDSSRKLSKNCNEG